MTAHRNKRRLVAAIVLRRQRVLDAIASQGPSTSRALSVRLGVPRGPLATTCREMCREGWLREVSVTKTAGRSEFVWGLAAQEPPPAAPVVTVVPTHVTLGGARQPFRFLQVGGESFGVMWDGTR